MAELTENLNETAVEYTPGGNDGKILTSTLWNQSGNIHVKGDNGMQKKLEQTYNQYCPYDYNDPNYRCVTGCTNTADASVLYYWLEQGYRFNLTVSDSDYCYVEHKVTMADAEEHGIPSTAELNKILATDDPVGNGDFIAALNMWCGLKNKSTYTKDATSTSAYWSGEYTLSSNSIGPCNTYLSAGFDSAHHIGFRSNSAKANLFYDETTNSMTEVGFSVVREVLDYGEVIRVGIPGHAIYMDGYRSDGNGGYEYHLNFGWGIWATATKWYTVDELTEVSCGPEYGAGITGMTIDITPDLKVNVSSTRGDYYGGSMLRGLERINNVVNEKTTTFAFDESIAGENIDLTQAMKFTSKVNLDFVNFAVSVSTTAGTLFYSDYGMNFDMTGGSIIVNNESASAAVQAAKDKLVVMNLDNSYVYTGYQAGGVQDIRSVLNIADEYVIADFTSDFLASVSGYSVKAGGADDIVSLTNSSAMLGKFDLGGGSNTLNITDGSMVYGEFFGAANSLDVNLTVSDDGCGAMIVWTTVESDKNFYEATGGVLDVSVSSWAATAQAYELYTGVSAEYVSRYSVRLTLNGETYELNSSNLNVGDFGLSYNGSSLVLNYDPAKPEVLSVVADVTSWTNDNVLVSVEFSVGAVGKYSFDGETWSDYSGNIQVENNGTVYIKAINPANVESDIYEFEVGWIDKNMPEITVSGNDLTEWQTGSIVLTAQASDDLSGIAGIFVSLDGKTWLKQAEITVSNSYTVYFKAVDNAGNEAIVTEEVTYLDNTAPEFVFDYNSEWTNADLAVTVTINEPLSGLKNAQCSYDQQEWFDFESEFTFSQNGKIYFRGEDNVGNYGEAVLEIDNIDRDAPELSLSGNVDDWTSADVTISALATDAASGIKSVEYSFDNENWFSGTDAVVSANTMVYFRVTDKAGNVTLGSEEVTKVDQIAPELAVTGVPENWTNADVTLTADASDALSGLSSILFSTDGVVWTEQNSAVITGSGKVYFKAVDNLGNETIEEVVVDKIDKNAAELAISGNAVDWTAGNVVLSAVVSDDASGIKSVEYSFDNENWFSGTDAEAVDNGMVYFRVTDNAGNVTLGSEEVTKIDKTGAIITVSGNVTDWINGNVTLDAVAVDSASGVQSLQYSFDNKNWFDYTAALDIEDNGSVYFKAVDNVGNVTLEKVVVDKIDKDAPVVTVSGNAEDWTNQDVILAVNTADASGIASLQYSFDNVTYQDCNGTVVVQDNTFVYIKAVDKVGLETFVSIEVDKIDKIAPDAPVVSVDCPERLDNVNAQVSAEFSADSVQKQYSFDQQIWHDYTGLLNLNTVGEVYFRGVDRANNISEVVSGTVDNVDEVADLKETQYIFIKKSFTEKNTANKKQNNIPLQYNVNAFSSMADAVAVWGSLNDYEVVLLDSTNEISPLVTDGKVDCFAGSAVLPTIKESEISYSYKSNSTSRNKVEIISEDVAGIDFKRFATVNVMLASSVGGIIGGKASNSQNIKNTVAKNGDKTDTLTQKSSEAASGKIKARQSEIEYIGNYSSVVLDEVQLGTAENCTVSRSVSEKVTLGKNAVTVNNSVTEKVNTSGTLSMEDSRVDLISGFATVKAEDSNIGIARRQGADGAEYVSAQEKFKVQTLKDGQVRAVLEEKNTFSRGGKFTAEDSVIGEIVNYNTVVLEDSFCGDLSNSLTASSSFKYEQIFIDIDAYLADGFDREKAELTAMEIKNSASGSAKINESSVGNMTGFKTVTLDEVRVQGNVDQGESAVYKQTVKQGQTAVSVAYSRGGSLKAEDTVIAGYIANYATVQLDNSVAGDITLGAFSKAQGSEWSSLTYTEKLAGSVTLKNGSSVGVISNFNSVKVSEGSIEGIVNVAKFTVNKGDTVLGSFVGSAGNDTVTIAKGATLVVDNGFDFGSGKDKLSIAGTLVLNSSKVDNLESISGKGEIAVTSAIYNDLNIDYANILNLGATTDNFRGSASELSDNTVQKAAKWDGEEAFCGWLGLDVDCVDDVDYIVFTAEKDGTLEISSAAWQEGTSDYITLRGVASEVIDGKVSFAVAAGEEMAIRIVRRDSGSMSYTATLA